MLTTGIENKRCKKCDKTKPTSEFYRQGRNYTTYCKDCMKALSRQRVLDGRDKASKIKYEQKLGHFRGNSGGRGRVSLLHKMCVEMLRNAKKRSLFADNEFNLTLDFVKSLVSDFCENNHHVITLKKNPFKPSLDRIDNAKGYTTDNVVICWQIENYCKNTFAEEDVIEFCKRKLGLL